MAEKSIGSRWTIWTLAIIFLFYEFFLRVFPSVMSADIMRAFGINAAAFGTLSAFYFYAYAPMQLPVGVLMDRFGARRLLTFASFVCGIGGIIFYLAPNIVVASMGRFCMGLGSAFAFVGMIYVNWHWFPKGKLGLLIGLGNSVGMLGAAGGEGPLSRVVTLYGWRNTVLAFGLIGIALSGIILLCIRKEPKSLQKQDKREPIKKVLKHFGLVFSNRQTWLNGIAALMFYMTTGAFAGLWGIPFLQQVYGVDRDTAAYAMSMVFIGWIVGGPIIGLISDLIKDRKWVLVVASALALLCTLPVIYYPKMNIIDVYICLFLVGFFGGSQLLYFSFAVELNHPIAKGCASAITNFIVAVGTSILQPLVGVVLDFFWDGTVKFDIPIYSSQAYQKAMTIFPITMVLAILFTIFTNNKKSLKNSVGYAD